MQYGREYARRPGGGWVVILLAGLALLLRFGGSQPIVELREKAAAVWAEWDYAGAIEDLGKSVFGEGGEPPAAAVFGRQILGFGGEE